MFFSAFPFLILLSSSTIYRIYIRFLPMPHTYIRYANINEKNNLLTREWPREKRKRRLRHLSSHDVSCSIVLLHCNSHFIQLKSAPFICIRLSLSNQRLVYKAASQSQQLRARAVYALFKSFDGPWSTERIRATDCNIVFF